MKSTVAMTSRQVQIIAARVTGREPPGTVSHTEIQSASYRFLACWIDRSKTARELAASFAEQLLLEIGPTVQTEEGIPCGQPGCLRTFRYPAAKGLHQRKAHGIAGTTQTALPRGKHHIITRRHAADRLKDLLGLQTYTEAAEVADRMYREAKPVAPGKDGGYWYEHPQAYLMVIHRGGAPILTTVTPPSWTLLPDVGGGDWYWVVGREEDRVATR